MPRNQAIRLVGAQYTTDQGSIPAEFCCGAHNEDLLIGEIHTDWREQIEGAAGRLT